MPTPITKKGYDALKAELDRLRKVERPQVIEAIAEARAHGDLSENAEYDAAKERQGFIEARIAEIETKLADARIVEIAGRSSETVVFGAMAHFDDRTKAQQTWQQFSGGFDGCSDATSLQHLTWDGAQASSYRTGSDYLWVAREGQSMAVFWVAGHTDPLPAAVDTRTMTAIVAGLQDPDSFQKSDPVTTGSATSSAEAVPYRGIDQTDFEAALGSWDSGWEKQGAKSPDTSLPCVALDFGSSDYQGGAGSSVGTNGDFESSWFASDTAATSALDAAQSQLESCNRVAWTVDTVGTQPQVLVASSSAGVAWIVRNGSNIGVITIAGGHADPPAEVSATVGDLINRALRTTNP